MDAPDCLLVVQERQPRRRVRHAFFRGNEGPRDPHVRRLGPSAPSAMITA